MSRLPRPYIPLAVRVEVAHRQLVERKIWDVAHLHAMAGSPTPLGQQLKHALGLLFKGRKAELHHRPALENRWFNGFRYKPHANDPDHLVYLENNAENNDHYIETHVRGKGALRSDTGTRNHQKALDRNRGKIPRKKSKPIKTRGFQKPPEGYKHQWGRK